jgi:hypothetical protein
LDIVLDRGQDITSSCISPALSEAYARSILNLYLLWSSVGLYHFDLKLDNFVAMPGHRVLVIDWGLMRTDCDRMYALDGSMAYAELHRHPALLDRPDRKWGKEPYETFELWALCRTLRQIKILCGFSLPPAMQDFVDAVKDHKCHTRADALARLQSLGLVKEETVALLHVSAGHHARLCALALSIVGKEGRPLLAPHKRTIAVQWLWDVIADAECWWVFGAAVLAFDLWCASQSEPLPTGDIQLAAVCAWYLVRLLMDNTSTAITLDYIAYTADTYTREEMREYARSMFIAVGALVPWLVVINSNCFTLAAHAADMFGYNQELLVFAGSVCCAEVCADPALTHSKLLDACAAAVESPVHADMRAAWAGLGLGLGRKDDKD